MWVSLHHIACHGRYNHLQRVHCFENSGVFRVSEALALSTLPLSWQTPHQNRVNEGTKPSYIAMSCGPLAASHAMKMFRAATRKNYGRVKVHVDVGGSCTRKSLASAKSCRWTLT
jgi:hypothetical protein